MSGLHINKFNPSNNRVREVVADEGGLFLPRPSFHKEGWIQRTATVPCMLGKTDGGRAGLRTRQEDRCLCCCSGGRRCFGDVSVLPRPSGLEGPQSGPTAQSSFSIELGDNFLSRAGGEFGAAPYVTPLLSGLMGHSEFPPHSLRVCLSTLFGISRDSSQPGASTAPGGEPAMCIAVSRWRCVRPQESCHPA